MVTSVSRLNKLSVQRHITATEQLAAANTQAALAFAAVEQAARRGQSLDNAASNAVAARAAAAKAAIEASTAADRRTRHTWLRLGEQPNPAMTRLLRPAASSRRIHSLQTSDGGTTSDPQQLAKEMITFWSGISNAATTDPEARTTVLTALREAGRRCPVAVLQRWVALTCRKRRWLRRLRQRQPVRRPVRMVFQWTYTNGSETDLRRS